MEQTRCLRQAVGDMDVAWSRARLDEKYLIHGFRKFTLGDRYLPEGFLPLWEFVRSKAPSATNHLAVHAELTQFLFRLLFGQEVDAVDTLFFGRLHIHQSIIQENALICL